MISFSKVARLAFTAAVVATTCLSGSAHATLVGDSITGTYYYPNLSTIDENLGTVIVGDSLEFDRESFSIDISKDGVVITGKTCCIWQQSSFNGFTLVDNTNPHAFDDLKFAYTTYDSNIKNYITITGNTISVNWTTFFQLPGYQIVLLVPEPETYAMLLVGLGLVGALARRRRA